MTKNKEHKKELVELLAEISDEKLMGAFLDDLFTNAELEELPKRLQIIKRLAKGETQRKVAKDLSIGIATVTRGSRELRDKKGGFNKVLEKYYGI